MDAPTTTSNIPVKRAALATRPMTSVFGALQREVDRLFEDFTHGWPSLSSVAGAPVRMDLADTKDGLELTADLPGLQEKDVQVTYSDGVLTVSGEKHAETEEKDKNYHFVERSYGGFSRSIQLPADVDAGKISAVISNGVLTVTVPRNAKAEPKKIEVKASA